MHPIRLKLEKKFSASQNKFKPIKFENHTLSLNILNEDSIMLCGLFKKRKKPFNSDLPIIISNLIEIAKRKGFKKIKGSTWIFAEHPIFAKKFGVTINPEQLEEFNNLKKEYNILKIMGLNAKKTEISYLLSKYKYPKNIVVDCIVKTEKGPRIKLIKMPYDLILLPFEIKL